jgi:hypothetical protein
MYDQFELPVDFKGEELMIPARLLQLGYLHKFQEVKGEVLLFERDEEGNYRALVDAEKTKQVINTELLKAIADALENISR